MGTRSWRRRSQWRHLGLTGVVVTLLALAAACGGGDDPTPTSAAPTATSPAPTATSPAAPGVTIIPPTPTATTPPIPAWQVEWEQTLEAAKEEGVAIVSVSRAAYRTGAEIFLESHPDVNLEFQVGRGNEARWVTEQKAGIFSLDVALTGSSTMIAVGIPAGIVGDTKGAMILPDVAGDENWIGVLDDHFCDDDTKKHTFCHWASVGETSPFLNTELVDKETFTLEDLFRPEFKGKWLLFDPRGSGSGLSWMTEVMVTRGTDWLRRLLTETQPVLSQDDRNMASDLIRGDFLFCAGCTPITEFHELGVGLHVQQLLFPTKDLAPEFVGIKSICCGSGTGSTQINSYFSSGVGGPAFMTNAPHANAGKVFLNWLLSEEGARAYLIGAGQNTRHCSARVDVQDLCEREIKLEDGKSFVSFDRTSTSFIEDLGASIAKEIYGGR